MKLSEAIKDVYESVEQNGTIGKDWYAYKFKSNPYLNNEWDFLTTNRKVKNDSSYKKTTVSTKGTNYLNVIKAWVKDKKPTEYWCFVKKPSSSYKDDVIEVFYK